MKKISMLNFSPFLLVVLKCLLMNFLEMHVQRQHGGPSDPCIQYGGKTCIIFRGSNEYFERRRSIAGESQESVKVRGEYEHGGARGGEEVYDGTQC